MEEKTKFADDIMGIWKRENYENIKAAHNDILEYLKEKNFDFFSVQYLLTMTYMELLISEYLESHSEELQNKLTALVSNTAKTEVPK
jgi:hypothetical protein